ncbi:ribosomal RNA small subunit methyltransferase H [Panicum miliaceum]|uniref:Ribosomal RNA small subunit methyltransferase H n=1 Tax=Panicum miliaceum TaxID=4540 RepID=A0A3L6QEI5_PANMI|nr:ribosomal RNA small subunit methyltransferase H [Panicum miliaceum]
MVEAHPEMELYVGMDVDPTALEIGRGHIEAFLAGREANGGELRAYTHVKNFKYIKQVLGSLDESLAVGSSGVDGILIDLGMSSMQVNRSNRGFSVLQDGPLDMRMDPKATLRAEDILNSWPELEVGRILRDYGEESNWQFLQKQIAKAREMGGLHSTGDLVKLIQRKCTISKGRQGWIKTATRVFQALRIAVNDELRVLEDSLHSSFDCLATGGRLAVVSFHSLEDRIVKKTFLELIHGGEADDEEDDDDNLTLPDIDDEDEPWFNQRVQGRNGIVLTKRPITPSQEEEKLNQRCRSAKLRVIQKA